MKEIEKMCKLCIIVYEDYENYILTTEKLQLILKVKYCIVMFCTFVMFERALVYDIRLVAVGLI